MHLKKKNCTIAGETLLEEVVVMAAKVGLVKPQDHIVCVQRMGESFVIKIVSVNDSGDGVEMIRPKSLINLIRVSPLPSPPPPPPTFFYSACCLFSSCTCCCCFLLLFLRSCFWLLFLFCVVSWYLF